MIGGDFQTHEMWSSDEARELYHEMLKHVAEARRDFERQLEPTIKKMAELRSYNTYQMIIPQSAASDIPLPIEEHTQDA